MTLAATTPVRANRSLEKERRVLKVAKIAAPPQRRSDLGRHIHRTKYQTTHRSVRKKMIRGDVAIKRSRSTSGTKSNKVHIFECLGLPKIGSISTGYVADEAFKGQIKKIIDYVDVIPLTQNALDTLKYEKIIKHNLTHLPGSGNVMKKTKYPIGKTSRSGEMITLDGGEFIQFEQGEGCSSLSWPSAVPVETAFNRGIEAIQEKEAVKTGFVLFQNGELVEGGVESVIQAVSQYPEHIEIVRMDGKNFAFTWESRIGTLVGHHLPLNECSIIWRSASTSFLAEFMRTSSTPSIGLHADELIEQFRKLMDSNNTSLSKEESKNE